MMTLTDKKPFFVRKRLLGSLLLDRDLITQDQIKHVLQIQEKQGGYFGKILVDLGYISQKEIVTALVIQPTRFASLFGFAVTQSAMIPRASQHQP